MTFRSLLKRAYVQVQRPQWLMLLCMVGIVLAIVFPTDMAPYRQTPPSQHPVIQGTEHYGRFVNTIVQVGLPIVKRDAIGIVQNVYIGIFGTFMTHGLKHALDPVTINGRRIGERPHGGRYNMPSGHSSLAASAIYFLGRRYGWWHLWYLIPITLMTMLTRVELNAHTWSAVIAGALVGILSSALFTGKRKPLPQADQQDKDDKDGKIVQPVPTY